MNFDTARALELLRLGTQNPGAQFHDGQAEAIRHLVENRGRLLVVQKTGWGKSSVYFIAGKLLRDSGGGPALLISPLLALMRNQIEGARRMGVRAETIHSDNRNAWEEVVARIRRDEVDFLLISPERLANAGFVANVLPMMAGRLSLLVIDEAHCISDWGHDFRPHYRLIQRIVLNLPRNLRLLATTATANNRVIEDLLETLGPDLAVMRGPLNRPSLFLQTIRLPFSADRMAWISENLNRLPGSGIIYTLTIRDAERIAGWLQQEGYEVECYTSRSGERRQEIEQALLHNRVKALIATTALGMGFDKPDLGFVIHYQAPASVVAYYQQVGRAGRAISCAYGILLSGEEETEITDYFIETAFPTPEEVGALLELLQTHLRGLSVPEMMGGVNIGKARIEKMLQLLSLEFPAPMVKEGTKWILTTADLSREFWERARRLTNLRHQEQRQMQEYVDLREGHMEFLIRALDGQPAPITVPAVEPLPITPHVAVVDRAIAFLRGRDIMIEPRVMWPSGGLPCMGVRGKIPPELRLEVGRCLCLWGDPGWGEWVRRGKYEDGHFSDELIRGLVEMVDQWQPEPFPAWITSVPSKRHPTLVADLGVRFAAALKIPFVRAIISVKTHPTQKSMLNMTQQALNLDGVFEVVTEAVQSGPVFMLDDMVDSRWTLTMAGYLLKVEGSGPVYPVALALTSKS
jgi:ATP-dependent DNA helicase RecQ